MPDFGDGTPVGCKGKIDFLFVIDNSNSMANEQSLLIDAFQAEHKECRFSWRFWRPASSPGSEPLPHWAFDEAQLDQAAFEFRRRHACGDASRRDGMYAATEAHAGGAKCYGWLAAH